MLLQQAAAAIKQGDKTTARSLIQRVLVDNPKNPAAWYGMSVCVEDTSQKIDCMEKVVQIAPGFSGAQQRLENLQKANVITTNAPAQPTSPVIPNDILQNKVRKPEIQITNESNTHVAGKSTREMAEERRKTMLQHGYILIATLVLMAVFALILPRYSKTTFWICIFLFIVALVLNKYGSNILDFDYFKMLRARRGAVAEEKIGDILGELGPDYRVLHDVVSRFGNIDHLVINKSGTILLLETKAHGGRVSVKNGHILVNGHDSEKDFIAQTHRNIYWLRDQIEPITGKKPWVVAIIVFTNAFVEWSKPVRGVTVTNKKFLLSTIKKESYQRRPSPVVWEKINAIIDQIA